MSRCLTTTLPKQSRIFTGASAGGLGGFLHFDYIRDRYPNARVTGVTIAGFYFYASYYDGPNATTAELADFTESGIAYSYKLYDSFVDNTCKEAMLASGKSPSGCMIANISIDYVETDIFAIQSQSDKVVLEYHDNFPGDYKMEPPEQEWMSEWSANMSFALELSLSQPLTLTSPRKSGFFAAACYIHTEFGVSSPKILGLNFQQAFAIFYGSNFTADPETYHLADDCNGGTLCGHCPQ